MPGVPSEVLEVIAKLSDPKEHGLGHPDSCQECQDLRSALRAVLRAAEVDDWGGCPLCCG